MLSLASALFQRLNRPVVSCSGPGASGCGASRIRWLSSSLSNQLALSTHKIAIAHHRNIRISPKKLNDIVRIVRGLSAQEAIIQMRLNEKRKSVFVQKCIENAVNNAVNNFGMKKDRLVVKEAVVGKGVYTRMIQIHGRGRTGELVRRRSHLTIKVAEQPYGENERKIGKYGPTIPKVAMRNFKVQQQKQQQQQQQQQ